MILCGKSLGKPTFGCPFCSACTPNFSDGELYTLGDLDELNQVFLKKKKITIFMSPLYIWNLDHTPKLVGY